MAGYQYKGVLRDVKEAPRQRPRRMTGFDPSACGTYSGYRRHQKWGVPACRDCKAAMAEYSRGRYQPRPPKGFTKDACGTWAGVNRHYYHSVPLCPACKVAARDYKMQWRARRKQVAA